MPTPSHLSPHRLVLLGVFSFSEWIRFLVVVTLTSALTVGIAYEVTRFVTRNAATDPTERIELLEEGARMRAYSNELIGLATEYLNQSKVALLDDSDQYDSWRSTVYLPKLNDYRRRLIAESETTPGIGPLLNATDSLSAHATRPVDAKGREAVAVTVLDAATTVESAIGDLGIAQYLNDPPRGLRFLAPQ